MRMAFYPRLAWDGLRKNRRMVFPYLLTSICMVMMHYILGYLSSPACQALLPHGGSTMAMLMRLGSVVMLVFSLIFLFYTNSFLIRRRRREFGLYNVLGMDKANLRRIITWESLFTAVFSLAGGLGLGMLLAKLAELGLVNLMGGKVSYRVMLEPRALGETAAFFALIFALIWLASVVRVSRSTAVSLLKSESVGEKPPKGKWVLGLAGILLLGGAYWLAVSITSPLDAILWFFVAVLMVILGTYLLMIAGSVLLCRILQRSKRYYYQKAHFVSVSSMAYRMKRNGAGLASICIICTMVLVMLSSSSCLWFGSEDSIRARYPREINLEVFLSSTAQLEEENIALLRSAAEEVAARQGIRPENLRELRLINLTGQLQGEEVQCSYELREQRSFGSLRDVNILSAEDYAALTGETVTLPEGEALMLTDRCTYRGDSITLRVGEETRTFPLAAVKPGKVLRSDLGSVISTLTLIVPRLEDAAVGLDQVNSYGQSIVSLKWIWGMDMGGSPQAQEDYARALEEAIGLLRFGEGEEYDFFYLNTRAAGEADFNDSDGGIFFLGILLSIVFLLAAVLIIYYKQLSEGYEDRKRFDIMQKVGMTRREIRSSINSQLLTVFFLPLVLAGLHLAFAFPMIRRLLMLFGLFNVGLFVITTLISFGVFALFYGVVYRLTSNAYYAIVSDARPEA